MSDYCPHCDEYIDCGEFDIESPGESKEVCPNCSKPIIVICYLAYDVVVDTPPEEE